MTDLEMIRLCAQAMGWDRFSDIPLHGKVNPLTNDTLAMALVKQFHVQIAFDDYANTWSAFTPLHKHWVVEGGKRFTEPFYAKSADLNHAIVECVSQMQAAKATPKPSAA